MFRLATSARSLALRPQSPWVQNALFHSSPFVREDKKDEPAKAPEVAAPAPSGGLGARFVSMTEVTISKIFPAGFGWQSSSVVADGMKYGAEDLEFFAITGAGDFVGVLTGHTMYYAIKKATVDPEIDMGDTVGTGLWLASAAFCSGFVWQPVVNFWQGIDVPFNVVFAGTWAGCGLGFFAGLRLGRVIYPFIPSGNYENFKNDATLSTAIGGATACFVGTDTAYKIDENWLSDIVGVNDDDSDIQGCIKAGSSTALGFLGAQTVLNVAWPAGKLWND